MIVCPVRPIAGSYPTVPTDDSAIGRMAAEHLMETGIHRFAFCGFDAMEWSSSRADAYCQRLGQSGYTMNRYMQNPEHREASWLAEQPFLRRWIESLDRPVALFCANDERAAHVAECCRLAGLRVPEQVAILGVDDDEYLCALFTPSLSSIALSTERSGYAAAALLDELISGKAKPAGQRVMVHPTHVVRRASTDTIAVEDANLRAALAFMRANAARVILVSDVADAVGVSERRLEQRFKEELGCAVVKMMHRMRAQHIARLLTDTSRPIGEIALSLGYTSNRHIARFFKRVMGTTPQAYREASRLRPLIRRSAPEQMPGDVSPRV